MKKLFFCFFAIIILNDVYSLGISELDTKNINELFNTENIRTIEGLQEGYKLFIDVISEMQMANDTRFDVEYIVNTYVLDIGFANKSTYDWIEYITGNIATERVKMTVFLNLLEMYIDKQKEIVFFNKNFYKGIITSLDEYNGKNYEIKEKEIEDLYIHGNRISFWGKEFTVTADNYMIFFYYDNSYSKYATIPIKKIIIDKKSGTTYFDHYIGLSKETILSLRQYDNSPDDGNTLEYYNKSSYVIFYFENDIVKEIEIGDLLR